MVSCAYTSCILEAIMYLRAPFSTFGMSWSATYEPVLIIKHFFCECSFQFSLSCSTGARGRPTAEEEVAHCGCLLLRREGCWWDQTNGGRLEIFKN